MKIICSVTGFFALVWILVRVIPKPSRANYPCIKTAFPFASTFILYVAGLASSAYFFKKACKGIKQRRIALASAFFIFALLSASVSVYNSTQPVSASITAANNFDDPLGPNTPIGEAKGIFPGRVVWIHNPDATNGNCSNQNKNDAYFNDKNTRQEVVDQMVSTGIKQLTGKSTHTEAWDALFRYFNINHGKGDVGYTAGETIFIKINAVTAWSGATPNGEFSSRAGIEYDTSPQTILTILRHLINDADVPQKNIYVGDPMCDIWNHLYDKFYAEFPEVNYCSKRTIPGRYKITVDTQTGITYSDKGSVMKQIKTHKFFKEMADAHYLINIPTLKGHRWAGVTFFAKNHFGSNTTDGSWQLHEGLMNPDNKGMRYGYGLYRVLVDLMGSKYLGGKTMLYFMEGLWATSYEHQPPQKFKSAPFNNDWCSSLFFSLDPVAIESVCLDIMQKEFTHEDLSSTPPRYTYVQWNGIDDYLHQAADSAWWPENIQYDPDNSGKPLASLGVHEHWNNTADMKYSGNLGIGNGIELILIHQGEASESQQTGFKTETAVKITPSVISNSATLQINIPVREQLQLEIFNMNRKKIHYESFANPWINTKFPLSLNRLQKGTYITRTTIDGIPYSNKIVKE